MPKSKNTRKAVQSKKRDAAREARYAALPYAERRRLQRVNPQDPIAAMVEEENPKKKRAAPARSPDLSILASILMR